MDSFARPSNASGIKKLFNESERAESSANSSIAASTALTPQIPSSQGSSKLKSETIWTLPAFQRDQFFAAAFYLSTQQPTQRREPSSKNRPNNPKLVATPAQEKFLDLIALLFARVKGFPQHVTATALKETADYYDIHVVKNGGPKEGDKDLAHKLTSWFNNKRDNATDETMQKEMANFWKERGDVYWDSVRSDWKKKFKNQKLEGMTLESKNLETTKGPVAELIKQYQEAELDMEKFVYDWNDVQSLMKTLMQLDSPDFNDHALAKLESLGRQNYPKLDAKGLTVHFRRLIKRVKLLATIPLLLKACHDFRSFIEKKKKSVQFVLPKGPVSDFLLDSVPITKALDSWVGPEAFESSKAFEREKSQAREAIKKSCDKNQHIRRFFHCELQLLDMFLTADEVYDYLGCSKLSCFMCWGVLDGSPYRTRWTHAKVYPACAFPFDLSTGVRHYQLALALKKVQDRLLDRVLRRVVDDPVSGKPFSAHPGITETDPWAQPDCEPLNPSELQLYKDENQESRKNPIQISHLETMSVQAIKIPCDGSTPELVPVTLIDKAKSPGRNVPISWSLEQLWVSQMQLDTEGPEHSDIIYWVVTWQVPWQFISKPPPSIAILHRLRYDELKYLPANKWCANIAKTSHATIDTDTDGFPWRDDVYLFLVDAIDELDQRVLDPIYDDMLSKFREKYLEGPHRKENNLEVLERLLRSNDHLS